MPFRKRSIREQMRMARELRRLQQLERIVRSDYKGTCIALAFLPETTHGAVHAALDLGFRVEVVRGLAQPTGVSLAFRAWKVDG